MEQTITLFLELEDGETADLEVVARATLAFAGLIREVTYIIDPSAELHIGFASGTEGSLSLNSVVKSLGKKLSDPKTRISILVGVAMWFGTEIRSYSMHKTLDAKIWRRDAQPSTFEYRPTSRASTIR